MHNKKCKVCKQEIKENEISVKVGDEYVHAGECEKFYNERSLNESLDDLSDVQLL